VSDRRVGDGHTGPPLRTRRQIGAFLPSPRIDREEPGFGRTLPEKFERIAAEVDLALALLTPDDEGRVANSEDENCSRARQNVLIEIGWFWGRVGRDRIIMLRKGETDIPSDLDGIEYYVFTDKPREKLEDLRKFFREHGLETK